MYLPDFIVLVDDGHGTDDPLHLVVEIKGYRARGRQGEEGHDGDLLGARREQPRSVWPLGVRRARDVYTLREDLQAKLTEDVGKLLADSVSDEEQ